MKLIVVHYHFRPGGIRRIIELATPYIARSYGKKLSEVLLVAGEAPDKKWEGIFENCMVGHNHQYFIDPSFGYLAEQTAPPKQTLDSIKKGLRQLFDSVKGTEVLVWAHNLGIARNILLARELSSICDRRKIRLISHHHDWWLDNRWLRWPEMRHYGIRTMDAAAKTVFVAASRMSHVTISKSDCDILKQHLGRSTKWLPNLIERLPKQTVKKKEAVRSWISRSLRLGDSPAWILPCRLLRRKNIGEALLVCRWLRPEAWLITTGSVSSKDEAHYASKIAEFAKRRRWKLRLSIMEGPGKNKPSVTDILAASEAVMLTSIQEGFGLPFLEAAASHRPLIARSLPNISEDLKRFGFKFPQYYDEIFIDPSLFNWEEERSRQFKFFNQWKAQLPTSSRKYALGPVWLRSDAEPQPIPFARLTLTGQLEVLSRPSRESYEKCVLLNPFLGEWKKRAGAGKLRVTKWPADADEWLSGENYAERFKKIVRSTPRTGPHSAEISQRAQESFLKEKLAAKHMFPLLWGTVS